MIYTYVDNFLPEDTFKKVQKWVMEYPETEFIIPTNWQPTLYTVKDEFTSKVNIKLPHQKNVNYEEASMVDYNLTEMENSTGTPMDDVYKAISNYMNINQWLSMDRYIRHYGANAFRYKVNCGLLIHTDKHPGVEFDNRYGITLFLNDVWHPNWGGETIVYKEPDEDCYYKDESLNMNNKWVVDKVYYPKRNRLVIIDGQPHQVKQNLNENIDRITIQIFIAVKSSKRTKPVVRKI